MKVLGGVSGDRFMAAMQSMRANLGQKCSLCHLVEEKDFASDAKEEKRQARAMIRMNEEINRRTFGGKVRVTCWTCHRAEEEPPKIAFSKELPARFAKMHAGELSKKAETVFKDIRQLQGMDVRNFGIDHGLVRAGDGREVHALPRREGFRGGYAEEDPGAGDAGDDELHRERGTTENNSPVGCGTCHRGRRSRKGRRETKS